MWDDEGQQAFKRFKLAITSTMVLGLLDFLKPFIAKCDAFEIGLRAILYQGRRPIAYFTKVLHGAHLMLSTYDVRC